MSQKVRDAERLINKRIDRIHNKIQDRIEEIMDHIDHLERPIDEDTYQAIHDLLQERIPKQFKSELAEYYLTKASREASN